MVLSAFYRASVSSFFESSRASKWWYKISELLLAEFMHPATINNAVLRALTYSPPLLSPKPFLRSCCATIT